MADVVRAFRDLLAQVLQTVVAEGFRQRLLKVAGFKRVPEALPMRNTKGATVYYLFFASHKPAAENIIIDIFNKYRGRGAR